jgi:hypothetical protein
MQDFDEITVSDDDAHAEGFEAAFNGECETSNRYPIGSDAHLSWNDGFESFFELQDDARKRNSRPKEPDAILEKLERMTVDEVAKLLDWPVSGWPGNCFGVALKLVEALQWTDATAVYGNFIGDVSPECKLFYGRPVVHHGWILTSQGCIVDPTRWVFDAAEPSVTILKPWEVSDDDLAVYDEGGEDLARMRHGPVPGFVEGEQTFAISGPGSPPELAFIVTSRLTPRGAMPTVVKQVCLTQVRWLANTPYTDLGDSASTLYAWFRSIHCTAFVPVDFWNRAIREGQLSPAA